jgi:large subunit ribosomal protein L17
MRHLKSGKKFGRSTAHRRALFRNQTTDFLRHGKLVTTEAKAKRIRSLAEQVITLGKGGSLHQRRQAAAYLFDTAVVKKVFDELAPRYKDRPGGYTRIVKLGPRPGDNADVVQLELV